MKKKMSMKEKASMGLRFQQAVTLDDFLDGYNAELNMAPERVLLLTKSEKSKRSSYVNYWKPFARIFRDALFDFETLFGDKACEYIGEFELAMEEALAVSAGADKQIESRRAETLEICCLDFHFCFSRNAREDANEFEPQRHHESHASEDVHVVMNLKKEEERVLFVM